MHPESSAELCASRMSGLPFGTLGCLGTQSKATPSNNRWGSQVEHDAAQLGGDMFWNIHARSLCRAFKTWQSGDVSDATDEYRQYIRGKVWRSVKVVSADDYGWRKAIRTFALEPVDHFWVLVQHMDEIGSCIADMNYEPTNPIRHMRTQLAALIFQEAATGPLGFMLHHYEHRLDDILNAITDDVRSLVCSVDAQAY